MIKVVSESNKEVILKYYSQIGHYDSGRDFDYYFSQYDGKYPVIWIHLHCYGGSVFEGNLIYTTLMNAKSEVNIKVVGVAASMGSIFLITGKDRPIVENGFVMVHCPVGGTRGNAKQHLENAKLLTNMEDNFIKKYSSISGLSEDEVRAKWFDGNDHWLNAEEAVQYGFATRIVEPIVKNIKTLDTGQAARLGEESMFNRYAAQLLDKPNNTDTEMKKEEIISRYNLPGVTAESSDTAVLEALDARMKAEKDAKEAAQKELSTQKESEIKALVNAAHKEGKIKPVEGKTIEEQKEVYLKIGKSAGVEALRIALSNLSAHESIGSKITPGGSTQTGKGDRSSWTWDDYQKKDPDALEVMAKSDPDTFRELYKAEFGAYPK